MNSFKLRHLLLIPVIALAVNACAKRDSKFGQKGRPGAAGTNTPDNKVTTGGSRGNVSENLVTGGSNPNPSTDPEDSEYLDGDSAYSKSCVNPIEMSDSENEEQISAEDLLKADKGSYTLVNTHYFIEIAAKGEEEKQQVYALGSEYKTPENFAQSITDSKKIFVNCHTVKPVEAKEVVAKIRGSVDLPNSFDAETGKVPVMRQDKIEVLNGTLQTTSTLYKSSSDLAKELASPSDAKTIITKADGEITIKKQYAGRSDKSTVTVAGTYKLVKAESSKKDESKAEGDEK